MLAKPWRAWVRTELAPWAAGLAALLVLALLRATSLWAALEHHSFDLATTLAATGRVHLPSTIVAIDEPTFQQLQHPWPFARSTHARLIDRLRQDGAAAIALDVVFADPSSDPAQDAALARAIQQATTAGIPVVLASAQEQVQSTQATLWTQVLPLALLREAGARFGDAGVQPDDDFVVRQAPQHFDENTHAPQSFAAVLAHALALVPGQAQAPRWIAYRGPRTTIATHSYYQALEPGLLPPGFFRGKIVFVGHSARITSQLQHTQADMFNAPFAVLGAEHLFAGVELHATLLDNLAQGDGLRPVPDGWHDALALVLLVLIVPASRQRHPGAVLLWVLALMGAVVLASWGLWTLARWWWVPLPSLGTIAALYAVTALVAYAQTRQRARQTRAMFAQYVPAPVVQRLIEQPDLLRLGGEMREVTLLFTDLAQFTTLSERLSAEQTVEVLTGYFNAMTPLVHAQGGTVDKFIGDAIMAFWGAPLDDPHHAEHATRAALAMQQAMTQLVTQLQAQGLPPIQMRIGLHTGRVVVGNVGSVQRFSYTAIGDAVNLAARLEGANKAFGTGILLSQATAAQLPPDLAQALRPLDDVIVKGKTEPVRVFTPCSDVRLCHLAAQALSALSSEDWDAAQRHITALRAHSGDDKAARHLHARLQAMLEPTSPHTPGAAHELPQYSAVALDKL